MNLKLKHKYYLGTYIFGYVISLLLSGIPSIIYIVPLKMTGLFFGIGFGNAFYLHKEKQIPFTSMILINVKNTIIVIILFITTLVIKDLFLAFGVDVSFITAPF